MCNMWLAYSGLSLLSLLTTCGAVPINREFSSNERPIYVDISNEKFGNDSVCVSDDVLYKEGDPMPTANLCERCTCRPPKFVCELVQCEVKHGCRALQKPNQCCPEYKCDCERDGKVYQNGERLPDAESPCQACYCQGGEIGCTVIECYRRDDCEPRYVNGTCCPKYDHCPPLEPTPMTFLTSSSSSSSLENINPSSSGYEDDLDAAVYNSNENIQDNAVDSSIKVDVLGEKLSYIAPNPIGEYEQDTLTKADPGETSSEAEILEENMSEVHTEITETTSEQTQTEKSAEIDFISEQSIEEVTTSKSENINSDEVGETLEETTVHNVRIDDSAESAEATTKSVNSNEEKTQHENDGMMSDGGPAWYLRDSSAVNIRSEEIKDDSSQKTSFEQNQEDGSGAAPTENSKELTTTTVLSAEANSNEHVHPKLSEEIPKYGSKSEESTTETSTDESISTTSENDEVPVLAIEPEMTAENMSIIIPEVLISSKLNKDVESSLTHEHEEDDSLGNKDDKSNESIEDEKQIDFLRLQASNEFSKDSNGNYKKETQEATDSLMVSDALINENGESKSQEKKPVPETTEVIDSAELSTTPNVLEGEHPGNIRDSSETELSTETTEVVSSSKEDLTTTEENVRFRISESSKTEFTQVTGSNEESFTTANVLEGEHSDSRREGSGESDTTIGATDTTGSDEVTSTIQNVLEGEHPDNQRASSETEVTTEVTEITESAETLSTTQNVLEGEHPQKGKIDSSETVTTEISEETGSGEMSTTPNVLEGEHPKFRSGSSKTEITTEITETTNDYEESTTVTNIGSVRFKSSETETTSDEVSTTPNMSEREHESEESSHEESTGRTDSSELLSTTPNVLEGEHPDNSKDDSNENTSTTETTDKTGSEETSSAFSGLVEESMEDISSLVRNHLREHEGDKETGSDHKESGESEEVPSIVESTERHHSNEDSSEEALTTTSTTTTDSSDQSLEVDSSKQVSAETEETETTTYQSTGTTEFETTTNSEENSAKILPPLPKSNHTVNTDTSGDSSESSNKEPLPEEWLKENNETIVNSDESKEKSTEETSQTEISTEITTSSDSTITTENSLHSFENSEISSDKIHSGTESKEDVSTEVESNSRSQDESDTTPSDVETTTILSSSSDLLSDEVYSWDTSVDKSETHESLTKEGNVVIKKDYIPSYRASASREWNTDEIYSDTAEYYSSSGAVRSYELGDPMVEATTTSQNTTETTTTSTTNNETETTTPKSSYESFYNEGESNASTNEFQQSVESSNSQNEEIARVKDDYDFWNGIWG